MQTISAARVLLLLSLCVLRLPAAETKPAKPPRTHSVTLGAPRRVPYTPAETPAGEKSDDTTTLKVRPLLVDGFQKEWTTGDLHEITDRSFTIRRVLRVNDQLPGESIAHWVWQPGPWLLVDRVTGHISALHLPDFDPAVSNVTWFRDYAAYCGIATTAKGGLFAVVAQVNVRKPAASRALGSWPQPGHASPVCQPATWQRLPMRATIQPTGGAPITFDVIGTSSLIEENDVETP